MIDQLSIDTNSLGPWRAGQPETARLAALANYGISGEQRVALFGALVRAGERGLTAHEAKDAVGDLVSYPHVASTRLTDLRRMGYVEQTTETRLTPSGRKARVWVVTLAGLEVADRSAA